MNPIPTKPRTVARTTARWLLRGLAALGALLLLAVGVIVVLGWRDFGQRATGPRRARMEASPQWRDKVFVNPQPLRNTFWPMVKDGLNIDPNTSPTQPLPVATDTGTVLALPASGLRVTWFGHSAMLLEIDGHRILTDPVWSDRASPLTWLGPQRWFAPPVELRDLPPIDAVVISHDHYDHLDRRTIVLLNDIATSKNAGTRFIVPLGVGAHLASWGVPEARIVELDWWDRTDLAANGPEGPGLQIVGTPARHASGRMIIDDDSKLWTGYAFIGPRHRVYYSGDTGLFPALREIGSRLGPFDLTMIEVGQYGRAWPDWHLGPEQAVRAHGMVGGRVLLPVHWGAFALAYHGWTEPVERTLAAAVAAKATVITPRPGQPVEIAPAGAAIAPPDRWWPALPWRTGAQAPIVSTQMN